MRDTVFKLEEANRVLVDELHTSKQKFEKLRKRKGGIKNQRICGNCKVEFKEEENFNWSCRTH